MIRITADSNVYISAFQFGGRPLELLSLAAEGTIDLAVSDHILEEVIRTLERKFDWPANRLVQARLVLGGIARRVAPEETLDIIKEDPSDTGPIRIVTGADMLTLLSDETV